MAYEDLSLARFLVSLAMALALTGAKAQTEPLLELVATVEMPGVKGRIDHMAVDLKGHRLFVAALGNDTVEVVDTKAHKHLKSLSGFREPQGLAFLPGTNRLVVANGQGDRVDIVDGSSLAVLERVAHMPDADNVRHDAAAHTVLVGYGKGALAILDENGKLAGRIDLSGHPESFQLERSGPRAFVNVPSSRDVVVVDRVKREVVAKWDLPLATGNYPMALDEEGRRLFVGARFPAMLLVYDIDSGKLVTKLSIGGDTDDVFFDAQRKRVYVICGEGRVDVIRHDAPNSYRLEASIETAPRARTGLFSPEEKRLFVAAPAGAGKPARILAYRLQ